MSANNPDWPRPIVHIEIQAIDAERQRAFYAEMFSWNIGAGPIMNFAAGLGAPEAGPAGHIRSSAKAGVTLYIQVRDLAESAARCRDLGGTVIRENLQIPGGATLTSIADPEGNAIMLVQE